MLEALRHFPAYVRSRFPPQVYGVALVMAYAGCVSVFSAAAGRQPKIATSVCSLLGFILIFLLIRLSDDIADVESDTRSGAILEANAQAYRLMLGRIYPVVAIMIAGIGLLVGALPYSLVIVGLIVIQPAVRSAIGTPSGALSSGSAVTDSLYGLQHEGTYFACCFYIYVTWRASSDADVGLWLAFSATALVWALLLIWKYSRAISRPGWEPYNLSWPRIRSALVALIILVVLSQLSISHYLRLASIYALAASLIGAASIAMLFSTTPQERQPRRNFGIIFALANLLCLISALSVSSPI